jgi:nucleoid-associated protein YejK
MDSGYSLSGRMERRYPVVTIVRLARPPDSLTNEEERTYTDNISAHGARLFSKERWQTGDEVRVTSVRDNISLDGKVTYCQKIENARFCVGVNFKRQRVNWSTFSRFDGAGEG